MSRALPVDERSSEAEAARRRLLLVSLEHAVVALPAAPVVEVLPARPYARIPGAPEVVAGLTNRRGRILTVVDLGVALDGTAAAVGDEHRVVVVSFDGREIGLAVKDVVQITDDWWSESTGTDEDGEEESGGVGPEDEPGEPPVEDDERLRVVELETVLAPLFGGGEHGVGEPNRERS